MMKNHKPLHGPGSDDSNTVLFDNDLNDADQQDQADLWLAASATKPGSTQGSGTTATSATLTTVTTAASSLKVNITWDSSVGSAPSGFTAGVMAAVQYLESHFSDPVTININVGYGEVGGTSLGSNALGESESYLTSVSYLQLVNALKSDNLSAADASVLASLPAASPTTGTYWITTAQAKALGLASATATAPDGYVGFSSTLGFTYNNAGGVAAGSYDFNGTVIHELTEVMGRMLLTGGAVGTTANSYTLLDLLHYSSAGVRDFSASTPGYFSVNGGVTNLDNFNTVAGGDAGDWASSVANDALDAFAASGAVEAVTPADLTTLDAIGWNSIGAPTGISVSPVTLSLKAAQGGAGLTASTSLGNIVQTGGVSTDIDSYALTGAGAAAFTLSAAGNGATLSSGAATVAGAAKGQLYALAVTATDTTTGAASAAMPINVVVGDSAADTIALASLAGIAPAAPTFVYALGGNDTISGTGITGRLLLDGGSGADTMTGGSGVNDYLYGAASDSTASTMDIITNFHTATDAIDLTGLGTHLAYIGQLSGNARSIAAGSVGWQTNGGSTYVYVNTTGASEALTTANMKIDLQGSLSLQSGNILRA